MDEAIMSVDETISLFITRLSERTGFKYLKSRRALKNTVGPIVLEILFFSSKWNGEGSVEINADLRISYKKYGAASTAQSTVAGVSFRPDNGYWYDISDSDKFENVLKQFEKDLKDTAVDIFIRFETDYESACQYLLDEKFYEYKVELDFLEEVLGDEKIKYRVNEIVEALTDSERQQIEEYKKGAKNKMWMLNRCNLRFIVEKGYA
ncbi:MAG: hypothetical protein MJ084_04855 [Saccharofermentans sp.]|nr:hypothetical protein [Saccharofermentans sp.]